MVQELGPRHCEDEDRACPRPGRHVLDEVHQARIGPLQVLEDEDDRRPLGNALEEPSPGGEELVAVELRRLAAPEQGRQARLDPSALGVIADELLRAPTPAGDARAPVPRRPPIRARRRTICATAENAIPSP